MNNRETFPPELLKRIMNLYNVLLEVLPVGNLDEWARGFVGEMRPENEVRIHEAIAVVFLAVLNELEASQQEKKRLYTVLALAASGMTVRRLEKGLPDGAPGYDELLERWKQAFTANERPILR